MSFKPEVSTDGGKSFGQNNQAFATAEEAETMAKDIFNRWLAATDWRVTESDQSVNARLTKVDGKWNYEIVPENKDAVETQG
jgi:hypothetical protein